MSAVVAGAPPPYEDERRPEAARFVEAGRPTENTISVADTADFQVMPALTDDELTALKTSIADVGIVVPVVVDQHGRILDGHHRRRIAGELGVDCPVEIRHVKDDDDARNVALTLNLTRRHLTRKQRRELIRREIHARPGDSDRSIARRFGCSPSTVGTMRSQVSNLDTGTSTISAKAPRLADAMRKCFDDLVPDVDALVARGYPPMLLAAQLSKSILTVTADADAVSVNAVKAAFKPLFDRLFDAVFTAPAPSQEEAL